MSIYRQCDLELSLHRRPVLFLSLHKSVNNFSTFFCSCENYCDLVGDQQPNSLFLKDPGCALCTPASAQETSTLVWLVGLFCGLSVWYFFLIQFCGGKAKCCNIHLDYLVGLTTEMEIVAIESVVMEIHLTAVMLASRNE